MKTVSILIGNTDGKLSQLEWAMYCKEIFYLTDPETTYFVGYSNSNAEHQNACFVFGIQEELIQELRDDLKHIRLSYNQDSIALCVSETEFI